MIKQIIYLHNRINELQDEQDMQFPEWMKQEVNKKGDPDVEADNK